MGRTEHHSAGDIATHPAAVELVSHEPVRSSEDMEPSTLDKEDSSQCAGAPHCPASGHGVSEAAERVEVVGWNGRRGGVTFETLRKNFHLPLHTAAAKFSMCSTTFKKCCRRHNVPKWPHRQLRGIEKKIEAIKADIVHANAENTKQLVGSLNTDLVNLQEAKAKLLRGPSHASAPADDRVSDSDQSSSHESSAHTPATKPVVPRRLEGHVPNMEEDDSDISGDEKEPKVVRGEAVTTGSIVITLRDLQQHFHLPLLEVAKIFCMCTTAFKKMCRRFDIAKWPHRQLRGVDKKIAALRAELTYAMVNDRDSYKRNLMALEEERFQLTMGTIGNSRKIVSASVDVKNSSSPKKAQRASPSPSIQTECEEEASNSRKVEIQNLLYDEDGDDEEDVIDSESPMDIDCEGDGRNGEISEGLLRMHFHLPLHTVAKKFCMCTTAFKKQCRRSGIAKWPHRQLRGIEKRIAAMRAELTYAADGDKEMFKRNLLSLERQKSELKGKTLPEVRTSLLSSQSTSSHTSLATTPCSKPMQPDFEDLKDCHLHSSGDAGLLLLAAVAQAPSPLPHCAELFAFGSSSSVFSAGQRAAGQWSPLIQSSFLKVPKIANLGESSQMEGTCAPVATKPGCTLTGSYLEGVRVSLPPLRCECL